MVRLTEVFRQAAQSQIIVNAHRINQGVIPELRKPEAESDFYFVEAEDPETAVPRIIELVKTRIPRRFGLDPIRDIQILCPINRGGVGARSLNIELQAASIRRASARSRDLAGPSPGDKVMQIDLRRVFRNCRRRCTRKRRQKPVSATLTPSTAAGGADGERCTGWPAAIAATTSASSTRSNSSSWRSSAARVGDQGQLQTVSFVLEADRRKIVDLPALALFEAGRSLVLGYRLRLSAHARRIG